MSQFNTSLDEMSRPIKYSSPQKDVVGSSWGTSHEHSQNIFIET